MQSHRTTSAIMLDAGSLLAEAYGRTLVKRDIQRALQQGGTVKSEVEQCLVTAFRCVEALSIPFAAISEVSAEPVSDGVLLGNTTVIHNTRMRDKLTGDAKTFVYVLTSGYDSQAAWRWLDGDYSLNHFQHMIGQELLYAIGRYVFVNTSNGFPHYRFARYAMRMKREGLGARVTKARSLTPDRWDARKVPTLLTFFDPEFLRVSANDSGCLSPLHSLLGVMMGIPTTIPG